MSSEQHATGLQNSPSLAHFQGRRPVYLPSPAAGRSMHALRRGEMPCWLPGLFSSRHSGIPVLRLQAGLQWKVKLPLLRLGFLQQALYLFFFTCSETSPLTPRCFYYLLAMMYSNVPGRTSPLCQSPCPHSSFWLVTFRSSLLSPLFSSSWWMIGL